MDDISSYRETPATGRTPANLDYENQPQAGDPSTLTDDRENPQLLEFERTWGHRLLAGASIALLAMAVLIALFCMVQLASAPDNFGEFAGLAQMFYGVGIVMGLLLIVPGVAGLYVAKHPQWVNVAIGLAIFALVLLCVVAIYSLATDAGLASSGLLVMYLLYVLLLAIPPVIYLVAALKIKRSYV